MTSISHSAWGCTDSTNGVRAEFFSPAQPACSVWQAEEVQDMDTDLKFSARCFHVSEADSRTFDIILDGGQMGTEVVPTNAGAPAWDQTFAGAIATVPYPSNPSEIDSYPADKFVPYYHGTISYNKRSGQAGSTAVCYTIELATQCDESYSGDYMELADYSSGTYYAADCSAASWMLKRLGANAYNALVYFATQRISCVVANPNARP